MTIDHKKGERSHKLSEDGYTARKTQKNTQNPDKRHRGGKKKMKKKEKGDDVGERRIVDRRRRKC
jgi:hypothetical protein